MTNNDTNITEYFMKSPYLLVPMLCPGTRRPLASNASVNTGFYGKSTFNRSDHACCKCSPQSHGRIWQNPIDQQKRLIIVYYNNYGFPVGTKNRRVPEIAFK